MQFASKSKPVIALFTAAMLLSTATVALAGQSGPEPASLPTPLQDFSLVTTGDSIISTRITLEEDNPRFQALVKVLKEGHATFTNFEMVTPKKTTSPAATSGDTYMATSPAHLRDLHDMGINMFGMANNHVYDYGQQGLLDTIEEFEKMVAEGRNVVVAGVGRTLGDARAPAYLDSRGGRVALIDGASSFAEDSVAGDPRPDMVGRPGQNPLRFITTYYVDQATFDMLKVLEGKPGFTGNFQQGSGSAGWWGLRNAPVRDPAKHVTVAGRTYELGATPGAVRRVNEHDMQGFEKSIKDAKSRSTYVLVSLHNHEHGPSPAQNEALGVMYTPADFIVEFTKRAIDAGADVYSGTGPHVLRGIEIYKGKPIMYSLGNLSMQNDLVRVMPTEFYNRYELPSTALPSDGFGARGGYDAVGQYESIIARTLFRNGRPSEVKLTPIIMRRKIPGNEGRFGVPEIADSVSGARILARMQEMSKPFGTVITIKGGIGYISLQ